MEHTKDGGPAFPPNSSAEGERGMSLRDWFAGQALVALNGNNPHLPGSPASGAWPEAGELAKRQATYAYLAADAMLAERERATRPTEEQ